MSQNPPLFLNLLFYLGLKHLKRTTRDEGMRLQIRLLWSSSQCISLFPQNAFLFLDMLFYFPELPLCSPELPFHFWEVSLCFSELPFCLQKSLFVFKKWISQKCPIVFHYILYSNFGLHDSLENAISQHLKWLIIQRFSKVSASEPPGGSQCPPQRLFSWENYFLFFSQ